VGFLSPVGLALNLGEHVALAQDEEILPVDLDLRAAVLRVQDLIALGDVERDALAVVVELAVPDGEELLVLRESDVLAKVQS
jgi:co-chaperonin GroES (HSP10)